jgi:integrase
MKCPECGSNRLWRASLRYTNNGTIQRWLCRDCGYRFSENHFKECQTIDSRQICALETKIVKNLVKVEPRTKTGLAGATKEVKGKIIEYLWFLKKEGYAPSTITRNVRLIKTLSKRGGNLLDPESIKLVIAEQENWKSTTKEHAVTAYTSFLRMLGKEWKKPKYNRVRKLPFIPQEKEVDDLISGCNRKTCAFLKLLKETGMRSGEAWQLEWTDINFEHQTVSVTPEKGSNPRSLPISTELIAMLKGLTKTSNKVFKGSLRHFRRSFRRQRKRVAEKLRNPRINHITFHTLRHFKATMEYHKTKDLLHVQMILGHRSILSTRMYTQLVSFKENDYHVKVAHNIEEACDLVKTGFQYVTGEYSDGGKIFRKPK